MKLELKEAESIRYCRGIRSSRSGGLRCGAGERPVFGRCSGAEIERGAGSEEGCGCPFGDAGLEDDCGCRFWGSGFEDEC